MSSRVLSLPQGTTPSPSLASNEDFYGLVYNSTTDQDEAVPIGSPMPSLKTDAGDVTLTAATGLLIVNKAVGAATQVTLPASPPARHRVIIKDGGGDAGANNITCVPAAGTIDGAANVVIAVNYGFAEFVYNGTEWNVLGSRLT